MPRKLAPVVLPGKILKKPTGKTFLSLRCVYEPIRVKNVEIKNRIWRSDRGTMLANFGATAERLIEYHVGRAEGGVGLTILEAATAHPSSILGLANDADAVIPGYLQLLRAIRPHAYPMAPIRWAVRASPNDIVRAVLSLASANTACIIGTEITIGGAD